MTRQRVRNICFHGIGRPGRQLEPGEAPYWISENAYLEILDAVKDRPDVALSFDDGNASDLELGLPALLERGLVATFFPLAGRLGRAGSLSESAIKELSRAGMSIGTHGMNHVPWRHVDEATQRAEMVIARDRLADCSGGPITAAALPLGRYDRRVLSQLRRLGYTRVFSSDRCPADPNAWLQPRFSARNDTPPVRFLEEVFTQTPLTRRIPAAARRLAKRLR